MDIDFWGELSPGLISELRRTDLCQIKSDLEEDMVFLKYIIGDKS